MNFLLSIWIKFDVHSLVHYASFLNPNRFFASNSFDFCSSMMDSSSR